MAFLKDVGKKVSYDLQNIMSTAQSASISQSPVNCLLSQTETPTPTPTPNPEFVLRAVLSSTCYYDSYLYDQ